MHFPRFWSRAKVEDCEAFGWSDSSLQDAQEVAESRAHRMAATFKAGGFRERGREYGYYSTALREEVVSAGCPLDSEDGLVSRNSYGVRVLNTSGVMFIDIDFKPAPVQSRGVWSKLIACFTASKSESSAEDNKLTEFEKELKTVVDWFEQNPSWGARLYKTAGGYRLLVTHDEFDPVSEGTHRVFSELQCDPLYMKLCKTQRSFRARIDPKPWRCGWVPPRYRWPFRDDTEASAFAEWQREFDKLSAEFATCKFVRELGCKDTTKNTQLVVDYHDRVTRAFSDKPLA
jgi:hypothetical protein